MACLAFPTDLATLRSGMAFQVIAMFQSARFFVLEQGTSSFPAVLLQVLPRGDMSLNRLWRGLEGLLARHASIADFA